MISFEGISFGYGRRRGAILDGFSWTTKPGRTALLGPNGAGKTTLLKLGADVEKPWSGAVTLDGIDPQQNRGFRREYHKAVGWMPQHIGVAPGMTGRDMVAYSAWLKGSSKAQAWKVAADSLERVDLVTIANEKASTYSGGQLRRLGLAQTLAQSPAVLLLDEPTAGLDPAQRSRFRTVLDDLTTDPSLTVIVSTHQVDDLLDLFETVAVLVAGEVRYDGPVSGFLAKGGDGASDPRRAAESAYAEIVGAER